MVSTSMSSPSIGSPLLLVLHGHVVVVTSLRRPPRAEMRPALALRGQWGARLADVGACAHPRQQLARLWVPAPMAHQRMQPDFFLQEKKMGRGDWESNPGCPWELTSVARRDRVTFEAWTELRWSLEFPMATWWWWSLLRLDLDHWFVVWGFFWVYNLVWTKERHLCRGQFSRYTKRNFDWSQIYID